MQEAVSPVRIPAGRPGRLSPASPAAPAAARSGQADPAAEAARAFATLLMKEVLKLAFPSQERSGLFPKGVAGEFHRDQFIQMMAEKVAGTDGFGLSEELARFTQGAKNATPR